MTRTREILLAPSILGANPLNISVAVDSISGRFDWLHVDVMDGHFVHNLSFGPSTVKALKNRYPDAFLDVHLMLDKLDVLMPAFIESGASQITIHAEVEPHLLHYRISSLKKAGVKAGVALGPVTSMEQAALVLPIVDVVLLMSVTPGFGGQSLILNTLEKARDLVRLRAAKGYGYVIEIDGGVILDNAAQAAKAGCDVLVMGSAVFGSSDPAGYLNETRNSLKEALTDVRGCQR